MLEKLKHMKLNIRERVLIVLLACSLAAFLGLGALSLHTLYHVEDSVLEQEQSMGERLSEKLGAFAEENSKSRLKEAAEMKALVIDRELAATGRNVALLADTMSLILKNQENYRPRSLVNSREQADISSGVPYVHYSPQLAARGVDPALAGEIARASNVADLLLTLSKEYDKNRTSIYAGSRRGYLICLDTVPGGGSIYPSQEARESFLREFDPSERPWYKLGEKSDHPAYTDVYTGADGYLDVTCVMPYYDDQGLAGVAGISYTIEEMYHQVADAAIGRTGVNFALDSQGRVIFSGLSQGVLAAGREVDLRRQENEGLAQAAASMVAGGRGVTTVSLYGQDYFLAYAPMKSTGWSFGSLIAREEVTAPAREIMATTDAATASFRGRLGPTFAASAGKATVLALLMFLFAGYLSRHMAAHITKPIYRLREGVRKIAAGNLHEKVELDSGDELQELAESFNAMTDNLEDYMEKVTRAAEEKERAQTEMNAARSIQQSMLPEGLPQGQDFELRASMKAAREVGGDFYDFFLLDEDHLMVTIADVSGKGVPASLFMVRSMMVLRNLVQSFREEPLASIAAKVNDELCRNNDAMMFVTSFMAILDLSTGRLSYVNAGHNPSMLYRAGEGKFSPLPVLRNSVLGGVESLNYKGQEVTLGQGDLLFLYTDGVTEAQNERGDFYGETALLDFLNHHQAETASPQDLLAAVSADLSRYAGQAEQSDDITMVALRYTR